MEGAKHSDSHFFFETIQDTLLYQYVNFPTRFRDGQCPSSLDLVFTNEEHMIDDLFGGHPLGKSDHIILTWKFVYVR